MSDHNSPRPESKMSWVTVTVLVTLFALGLYAASSFLVSLIDVPEDTVVEQAEPDAPVAAESAESELPQASAAATAEAVTDQAAVEDAAAEPVDGKAVYTQVCVACHQAAGTGVPSAFPPLAGSEWVSGSEETLVKIVLKGLQGPITVNGEKYNSAMPAWESSLNDQKVAAVLTYIRQEWGDGASAVEAALVSKLRKELAGRSAPFKADELSP